MVKKTSNGAVKRVTAAEIKARRIEGVEVYLPSLGGLVLIRPVGFDYLVKLGRIPAALTGLALAILTGEETADQEPTLEQADEIVDFLNLICIEALVKPRMVPEGQTPGDDEIGVWDLEIFDKQVIMQVLYRPLRDLAGFRPKPEKPVEPVPVEQDVQPASE